MQQLDQKTRSTPLEALTRDARALATGDIVRFGGVPSDNLFVAGEPLGSRRMPRCSSTARMKSL